MTVKPGTKNIIESFHDVDTFQEVLARRKFLTVPATSADEDPGLYMFTYTEEELLKNMQIRATFIKYISPIEKMIGFVLYHGIRIPV